MDILIKTLAYIYIGDEGMKLLSEGLEKNNSLEVIKISILPALNKLDSIGIQSGGTKFLSNALKFNKKILKIELCIFLTILHSI